MGMLHLSGGKVLIDVLTFGISLILFIITIICKKRKRFSVFGLFTSFAVLCIGIILIWLYFNNFSTDTSNEDLSTDTWSTDIKDHDEKIQFLNKYVKCPTEVLDTEYHIIFQDNSKGLVPGPSYWKVTAAIKINTNDIDEWTSDMEEVTKEQIDKNWWSELNINDWSLNDSAAYYKRPNERSYLVVYNEKGILLKYFYTD